VLAEIGRYGEAIDDLTGALRFDRSRLSRAQAQDALAFALGMSGDLEAGLEQFAQAERVIPHSNWLHYWKGLCLLHHDRPDEAASSLCNRVTARLNRVKRENAERLLAELQPPIEVGAE
jgi:tetratricopeptide (TPR) repeat protein